MNKNNKIEIRSGEVQEILGGVPSRLVRYGIIVFFAIFSLLILFSFIFKYPDVLRSSIVVTTENPPATLVARATGKIEKLFVKDNQHVSAGDMIALIQNPANYADVIRLEELMKKVQPAFDTLNFETNIRFYKNLELGSLQEYYSQFLTRYFELREFVSRSYYQKNDENLKSQLRSANLLYDRLWQQKEAVNRDYKIKESYYENQRKLFAREVISSVELQKAESEKLAKKSELDGMRTQLAEREMEKFQLEQKIIENNKEYTDLKLKHETALSESFNILKSEISNWELTYLMRSPIEGVVTFNSFYSENQNIKTGDRAFTVVPENMGQLIGKVELPIRGSGKVKNNLDVNVKFDNFPYMEFGLVRGKVKNVSRVPEDNFYMVEVTFPNGLVTNYNKKLDLQNELKGQAEIITEDLKLIQRFFNPLKALWNERVGE